MRTAVTAFALFLFFVLSGCRPFSENGVRKAIDQTPEEKEKLEKLQQLLHQEEERTYALVDPLTRSVLRSYGRTLKGYAERYELDWRLILAVMKTESSFLPEAVSHRGALGLMQIMPVTGQEIARALALQDVVEPINNIHGGIFYLRQLYDLFDEAPRSDRIQLALAAYNAGIGRVYDAQALVTFFNGNANKWDLVKRALPLLSKA
jgi:membrane-bound lytic murein transglycosylase F